MPYHRIDVVCCCFWARIGRWIPKSLGVYIAVFRHNIQARLTVATIETGQAIPIVVGVIDCGLAGL